MIPQAVGLLFRVAAIGMILVVLPNQIRDIRHNDGSEYQRVKWILIFGSVFLIGINVLTVITLIYSIFFGRNFVLEAIASPLNGFSNLCLGLLGVLLYKGKSWKLRK